MRTLKIISLSFSLILSTNLLAANEQSLESLSNLIDSNKYQEAEVLAKKLLKDSKEKQTYQFALAQIYQNTQQYDEAEEYIEKVLSHSKLEEKHWLMASAIYGTQAQEASIFSKMGYAKKAKNSLESLLKLNPKSREGLMGLIQFHLAAPGIAGGDEDEIPKLMQRLQPVDPTWFAILSAQQFFTEDEVEKGLQELDKGLEVNPNSVELLFVKGMRLNDMKNYPLAFEILNKIKSIPLAESAPLQAKNWAEMSLYQSAKIAAVQGIELKTARENLYKFMDSTQTQVPEAWNRFRLGQILWQLDEKVSAKAQFELIATLNPDKELKNQLKAFLNSNSIKM